MSKIEERSWWPELVELKDTLSLRELAGRYRVSPAAISNALKRNGLLRDAAPPGPRAARSPEQQAAAAAALSKVGEAPTVQEPAPAPAPAPAKGRKKAGPVADTVQVDGVQAELARLQAELASVKAELSSLKALLVAELAAKLASLNAGLAPGAPDCLEEAPGEGEDSADTAEPQIDHIQDPEGGPTAPRGTALSPWENGSDDPGRELWARMDGEVEAATAYRAGSGAVWRVEDAYGGGGGSCNSIGQAKNAADHFLIGRGYILKS